MIGWNCQSFLGSGDDNVTIDSGQYSYVYGGDGDDTILLNSNSVAYIYGQEGDDKVVVANGIWQTYIDLGEGNNTIEGTNNNQNHSFYSSVITAGDGNNTFKLTGGSTYSYLNNFQTTDGVKIQNDDSWEKINLGQNEAKTVNIGGKNYKIQPKESTTLEQTILYKYDAIEDKVTFLAYNVSINCVDNVEYNCDIQGVSSNIYGSNKNDNFTLLAGNNIEVQAKGGDDTITIQGNTNWSRVYGQEGSDTIYVNSGASNSAYGGLGTHTTSEVDGDDTFYINASTRIVDGGYGNDTYYVNYSGSISDNYGDNIYHIETDNLKVITGPGDDTFYIQGDNNNISSGGGDDYFIINGKNNEIDGGTGENLVVGDIDENTLYNSSPDPNIGTLIFSSLDEVKSFSVDGKTYTVTNNNVDGNGVAQNSLTYTYNKNTGEIILTCSNLTIDASDGIEHNIRLKGDNNIINGSNKNDKIIVETGNNNLINGNDGNDIITLNSENNAADGGRGSDKIYVNATSDKEITGGAGDDIIEINSDGNANIKTGTGSDKITGKGNNNNVNLDYGSNNILLYGDENNIVGGNGNNRISLVGDENSISTGTGTNTIGVNGDDNIINSNGDGTHTIIGDNNTINGQNANFNVTGEYNEIDVLGGDIKVKGNNNQISTSENTKYNVYGDLNTLIALGGYQNLYLSGDNNNLNIQQGETTLDITGDKNNISLTNTVDDINIKGNNNTLLAGNMDDDIDIYGNENNVAVDYGNNSMSVRGDKNTLIGGMGVDKFSVKSGNENYIDGSNDERNTLIDYGRKTTAKNVINITPVPFEVDLQVGDKAGETVHFSVEFGLGDFYVDFSTRETTQESLKRIDEMIDKVNLQLSNIGSTLNRLDSIYDTQVSTIENLSSAKSLITDADIAQESMNYAQKTILQQISLSLFAQSNDIRKNTLLNLVGV